VSFVERGLPPGWEVSELDRNHVHPERRWWARRVGEAHYRETREGAYQAAWESHWRRVLLASPPRGRTH